MLKKLSLALFFILSFQFTTAIEARDFVKIKIPNTKCGNGSPYYVWLNKKSNTKLLIEFMGGGACWSAKTCFGTKTRTWIFPLPTSPVISWVSNDLGPEVLQGPMHDRSMIYFPYCTGDVHAAHHVATYNYVQVYHHGYNNIISAIEFLSSQNLIQFNQYKDVLVYGASAGAIGAMVHAQNIEKKLQKSAHKTLVLDAPGLHFGKTFWDKFTDELVSDFQATFKTLGVTFDRRDHVLAKFMPIVANKYKDWKIGVLQGAQDIIMGPLFGELSPRAHRELVYSDQGIYQQSMQTGNVSVWVPDTFAHTFLLTHTSAQIRANLLSAQEFFQYLLDGQGVWRERTW